MFKYLDCVSLLPQSDILLVGREKVETRRIEGGELSLKWRTTFTKNCLFLCPSAVFSINYLPAGTGVKGTAGQLERLFSYEHVQTHTYI